MYRRGSKQPKLGVYVWVVLKHRKRNQRARNDEILESNVATRENRGKRNPEIEAPISVQGGE